MARLNYASLSVDAAQSAAFEAALLKGRAFDGTVGHLVAGKPIREGPVVERPDPCHPDRVVARYHEASAAVVSQATAAARVAADAWRKTHYAHRCALLREAKMRLGAMQVELAGVVSAETGKVRLESLAEVAEAIDLIEYYASEIEANDGYVSRLEPGADESRTDVLRPFGVFGVISPFNFPVALAVNMTSAALVTGNTVVVKPSDKTPRSTTETMRVFAEALPPGVLNVVQGGPAIGRMLVAGAVDGIAFTGSADVGWGIVRALQAGPKRRPVLAEMGGHNPAIVAASADLDVASAGIVRSAFGLSGQKCSSCRRVIVERAVADTLVGKLRAGAEALKVGDPLDAATNLGPVIDEAIAARIDAALADADEHGTIVTGGRASGLRGHYFRPIVVGDLPKAHPLTREELFAPFVTITIVDSFDDAIAEANAVEYGLTAGLYSKDDDEKRRFLDEIEAGVLYVNRAAGATTGAWPGAQPFCGWKSSGSTGKGGLGPWYLPGFMREQSRTIVETD